jgi:hypothetical protein
LSATIIDDPLRPIANTITTITPIAASITVI